MTSPLIGITTYKGKNSEKHPIIALMQAYSNAIREAGGIPVLIPTLAAEQQQVTLIEKLDGVLFSGGGDIATDRFAGEPSSKVNNVDPERDGFEIAILERMIECEKPFLGICRGLQVINVGLGGSLYTDIADQMPAAVKHDYYPTYPRDRLSHMVEVTPGTKLETVFSQRTLKVNSLHHQGISKVADSLKPAAFAPDGLVEAVELPGHPFRVAVQWHPEWLTDQEDMRQLFHAFIISAGEINGR